MRPLSVEEHKLTSFDGTEIAWHAIGEGLPVLLANGLGGGFRAWSHQIAYFRDRYRFVSWDYRGLYDSGPAAEADSVRVEHHALDAIAVMEAAELDRCAVFGWSMGVQVALEVFRRAPERVAAMVVVAGAPGRPWRAVLSVPQFDSVLPDVLRFLQSVPWLAEQTLQRAVTWPEAIPWLRRVGLASASADNELLMDLAASFAHLDAARYLKIMQMLGEHDATDVLPDVDVGLLAIAGDRDRLISQRATEEIAEGVQGAEWMLVPGGTHFVLLEQPGLVNLRIEKFFRERGYFSGGT